MPVRPSTRGGRTPLPSLHSQASSFPVNIQPPPAQPCDVTRIKQSSDIGPHIKQVFENREKLLTPRQKDVFRERSVKLTSEPRFQEMKHYSIAGAGGHFARLTQQCNGSHTPGEPAAVESNALDPDASALGGPGPDPDLSRAKAISDLSDRVGWQLAFDSNMKKLLVDFDLTEEPSCRLNHLERMHDWFTTHGQKQARKAKPAPNYISLDRQTHGADKPAGSAMKFPIRPSSRAREISTQGATFGGRKVTFSSR